MGEILYQHPVLMKALTHIVYYLELFIPVLILLPSRSGRSRLIAFILIILLHAGIGGTLYVGLFFVIGMASAIGLLPALVFNRISHAHPERIKVSASSKFKKGLINALNTLTLFVLCICFILNLSTAGWFPYQLRDELNKGVYALRLNQYWGMFSPSVLKEDGWFVYHGMDSIGRQWDLWRNQDYVDYKKPKRVVSMYKSDRWRKLAENMQSDNYTFLRPLYCKYIFKKWNREHPEKKMDNLNIYFMKKTNLPDYKTTSPEKILHCVCDEH